MKTLWSGILLAVVLQQAGATPGDLVVQYNFDATTSVASASATNVSASLFTLGAGLVDENYDAGTTGMSRKASNWSTNLDETKWFGFSCTLDPKTALNVPVLTFDTWRKTNTAPANVQVRISSDGVNFSDFAFVDLSGVPGVWRPHIFPGAQLGLVGSIFFRIYGTGAADPTKAWRIDDVQLRGSLVQLEALQVRASPPRGGFVGGGGYFAPGTSQTISAVPHRGWAFTSWQDANTNSARDVIVPQTGATYVASFVITGALASVQNDFDGDGQSDIGVFWPAGGAWNVLLTSGGSATYQLGYGPDIAVAADYDGDGKTDCALFEPPTGNWFMKLSSNGNFVVKNWGYYKSVPVPADYDGDGKTDIAVYDPPTGTWYILLSNTGQLKTQQWGWSQAIPVPADYDGDGKADIATYVPASGQWSILKTSDGQLMQISWGWSQAIPVPADYDGDGKADIATYVPAAGQWSIRRSSDGGLTQQNWGWSMAAPVPADYDGDGKADIATYCAPAGLWYVLKSSSGMISQNWGWTQAVPTTPQFQINRKYFPVP